MKTLFTLLVCFMIVTLLSGCSMRHANTTVAPDQQDSQEPFVIVNPYRDDPDNPSPHNPYIKKHGDIPEVRTYLRLKQKLLSGTPLTVDEAIALFTADLYLTPSSAKKETLKGLKETKRRHEKLGFPDDAPVLTYTGRVSHFFDRGVANYYNVRTLPDGTRVINDWNLPNRKVIIPPKEKSKSAAPTADHDVNSVPTEDEE